MTAVEDPEGASPFHLRKGYSDLTSLTAASFKSRTGVRENHSTRRAGHADEKVQTEADCNVAAAD